MRSSVVAFKIEEQWWRLGKWVGGAAMSLWLVLPGATKKLARWLSHLAPTVLYFCWTLTGEIDIYGVSSEVVN